MFVLFGLGLGLERGSCSFPLGIFRGEGSNEAGKIELLCCTWGVRGGVSSSEKMCPRVACKPPPHGTTWGGGGKEGMGDKTLVAWEVWS